MKTQNFKKIVDSKYILYGAISKGDYLYYCWYYKNKNGYPQGDRMGLGFYTTVSHAIRGLGRVVRKTKYETKRIIN